MMHIPKLVFKLVKRIEKYSLMIHMVAGLSLIICVYCWWPSFKGGEPRLVSLIAIFTYIFLVSVGLIGLLRKFPGVTLPVRFNFTDLFASLFFILWFVLLAVFPVLSIYIKYSGVS